MIKQLDENLYPMVVDWWKRHNFSVIPWEMLPKQNSYIAAPNGEPSVFASLYLPREGDAYLAWCSWFVKNPDATQEQVTKGFQELQNKVDEVCKANSLLGCWTFTSVPPLEQRLADVGYLEIEPGKLFIKPFSQVDSE